MKQTTAQPKPTPTTPYNILYISTTPVVTHLLRRSRTTTTTIALSVITNKIYSIDTRPSPPSVITDSDTDSYSTWNDTTDESGNEHEYNYNYNRNQR